MMKHMLMINAVLLMAISMGYLGIGLFEPADSDSTVFIIPLAVVAIVTASGFIEIDRRLRSIEVSIERSKGSDM